MPRRREYDLEQRLINFAIMIIEIVERLPDTRVGNHIAGQLLRCGTSPAANYGEAEAAESREDFVHKIKVVLKELKESRVWLTIIDRKKMVTPPQIVKDALVECGELAAIFSTSVATARRNLERK
ncbi:MAG: four helix bundle protein [Phycisphaerae bacterium]